MMWSACAGSVIIPTAAVIVPLDLYLFDQMKQFADIATVVTYDLRSRGRSDRAKDATLFVRPVTLR